MAQLNVKTKSDMHLNIQRRKVTTYQTMTVSISAHYTCLDSLSFFVCLVFLILSFASGGDKIHDSVHKFFAFCDCG